MSRPSPRALRRVLDRVSRVRLTVAGDLIADEFIYGQLDRVSREAPVLILKYDSTEVVPGGAGNAAANAAALGARVGVVGVVGRDEAGRRLLAALPARTTTRGVIQLSGHVTAVKTRILAGGVHSAKQQVVRMDREGTPLPPRVGARLEASLRRALQRSDAVILSDYGAGVITPDRWRRAVAGLRRLPPVFLDSRYSLADWTHVTACTPNESEVEALLGVRIGDDRAALEQAGRTLLDHVGCRAVLITRGSRGMALFESGRRTEHIPIVGSDQVTDVTGAGDTVIATFALAVGAGATFSEAAHLANRAGGIVVMKRGTATVSAAELRGSLADR